MGAVAATFPLLVCPPAGGPPGPTPRELGKAKMEQYGLDLEALQALGTAVSKSRCQCLPAADGQT